ncbi:glycosyltransferase family 4 protein [Aquibacillus rhizosphaerae]|uniref:Glycosyltransferase n=1 Tax=Aquibacillus rhizosphaerae TaxID=3051431 RepID=A0ABT7L1P4_9BACI|nr:glycosyltransferase [Aquibacillus sp. LR5S19]MDL4839768.1 glycosyltransferase [Aquibacillus sp. LR5S19]
MKFLQDSIQQYDIFHFHFGETFFPDKRDLSILKDAGKKMVVHHHGSDIRLLSVARSFNNPYVRVKPEWTEEKIYNNVSTLSKYIDHAIVQDHELDGYISNLYKHTHVIPHTIDTNNFTPQYPTSNKSPLVVHAPTLRDLKGTEYILNAVNELKRSGMSFQFKLIEGMSHDETMKLLSKADIIIDQLRIGACGFISSEAMAFGKPVICYIREDLETKYPPDLPVINANPSNITNVLKNLIEKPQLWKELGEKGRQYVETHHDSQIVAGRYIDVYKKL